MARSLVTGRGSLVGLVVPDLVHPFFAEIAKSLSRALRGNGFLLIVCSSEGDATLEQAEIEQMLALRLDTFIVASCQENADALSRVKASGLPLILIDRTVPGLSTHFLGSDDLRIGQMATEHLIEMGKKRVAHIRGPQNNVGELRFAGYCETLKEHGLKQNKQHIVRPAEQVFKVGGDEESELRRGVIVREEVGWQNRLMVDANQCWECSKRSGARGCSHRSSPRGWKSRPA